MSRAMAIVQSLQERLRLESSIIDARGKQLFGKVTAKNEKGKLLGVLDFSVFEDTFHIDWIEVKEEARGQDIATKLVAKLVLANGVSYKDVKWGMTTSDGTKLKKKLDKIFR